MELALMLFLFFVVFPVVLFAWTELNRRDAQRLAKYFDEQVIDAYEKAYREAAENARKE